MSRKEYFAYGSNLNFDQMAYRCPEATVVGTAKLDGYELAKVVVGLARGRKTYDKREYLKENDAKREIDKAMKNYKR
jgi:tmRNA-binding protein